jgi:hypothetical protein
MTPVTCRPHEDEAAHGHPGGQAPAASETELGLSIGFRCSWCSYRWARGGSQTVATVGLQGLRSQAETPGRGAR